MQSLKISMNLKSYHLTLNDSEKRIDKLRAVDSQTNESKVLKLKSYRQC